MIREMPALIGVDWGTSNLRAFLYDAGGRVLETRRNGRGISAIADGDFETAALGVIGDWMQAANAPVLMAGMIGSRNGWREVPYLDCPAAPQRLAAAAVAVSTALGPISIIPGLKVLRGDGTADVMRGEEVQLLGAGIRDGLVISPGTHCKWTTLAGGSVTGFRTHMTGEFFSVLKAHSILGRLMTDPPPGRTMSGSAFDTGVRRALAQPSLGALLFSVRVEGLLERIAPDALADYLSGILIGAEVAAETGAPTTPPAIIAEPQLASRYCRALELAGIPAGAVIDGEAASARGLWLLARTLTKG